MDRKYYSFQCWVDSLNLLSLLKLILLRVRYPYKKVRYLAISRFVKRLIRGIKSSRFISIESISESNLNMTSCEEREIYHESYRDKTSLAIDIARRASIEKQLLDNFGSRYNKSKIALFFKQEISLDIKEFLILNNFIKWFCSKDKKAEDTRHIIITKSNIWSHYLKEYKKDFTWEVYTYPDIKEKIQALFIPAKIIIEMIANSLVLFFSAKENKFFLGNAPKVGVLHAHGADLKKKADYFWFLHSGIDPKRVLVYFKYHCWPPKEESIQLIESYGMRWINLLPWKFSKLRLFSAIPEFYRFPHALFIKKSAGAFLLIGKLFLCYFLKPSKIKLWQWQRLADLINRITIYETFFTVCNIKVHHGIYGMGSDMIASSIAIELAGGVDLCHHWSNFDIQEIATGNRHDVYFSWGPYYKKNFFSKEFYGFKYLVYIGYPYDNLFSHYKKKAIIHRQKILNNGARFIICFFDQTYPLNWPKTNESIKSIYHTLLNKILTDSEFGLITKPKKIRNFWERPALRSLNNLAQEAYATGRCLFLDGNTFANEAAQAADLVIGFGVYSTPALEAALSGRRAITCDLQNLSSHPFYKEGFNSIVFNKLEVMMQSIEQFRKDPDSSRLGDYSFLFNEIDPFRDGAASERAGILINWMLDEFDKGINNQEVLERVVSRYRNNWGADKVIDFQGEEGFSLQSSQRNYICQ